MDKFLSLIILLSVFNACQPSRDITKNYKVTNYCYNGSNTGIDSLIRIDGYYSMYETYKNYKRYGYRVDSTKEYLDTNKLYFVFYKDGIFLNSFYKDLNYGMWGSYYIAEDTIKALYFNPPGSMSMPKIEIWFRIIDQQTLQWLNTKYWEDIKSTEIGNSKRKFSDAIFTQFKNKLPDPNKGWLKNKKWFWCSENAYKTFKIKQKTKR